MRSRLTASIVVPLVAVTLVVVALVAGACGARPESPESAEADRLWNVLQADPTPQAFQAFRAANLAAAVKHGELHDRAGIEFQLRAYEAQADEAARTKDADEAARLGFEVLDGIDDLERRDLIGSYDETLPGARERLKAARARAAVVAR